MKLHTLPALVTKSKRRLGRGHGTGRGKTAGRGTKGQKARGTIKPGFEGGQLPLMKRLPLYRGKMKNRPLSAKPLVVNLKVLGIFPKDSIVNVAALVKYQILDKKAAALCDIKILGDGDISVPLKIELPISKQAAKKIIAAGGTVVESKNAVQSK